MSEYLISLGGQLYLPNQPDGVMISIADAQMYEIVETPFVTGLEYDQTRFVCRGTAVSLAAKYPDMWTIVEKN